MTITTLSSRELNHDVSSAKKAAAVLGTNYPGSKWYDRAYQLMQKHPA